MKYSYFPGCTLKNKAKDLEAYAVASSEVLGFELEEIENWQCCGAVYPLSKDEIAVKLPSVRALMAAKEKEQKLVTICSACHNVIKQVNFDMLSDENVILKVNNYLALENKTVDSGEKNSYHGETQVIHYLELLRDEIGWANVTSKVTNALKGKKIGAYYGCLLLRPGKVMQMDDPENPQILEDFIKAIGAVPVKYALRNECCGAYTTLEDKNIPKQRCKKILDNAIDNEIEILVTACPLCRYNLVKNIGTKNIRVVYFTELLAEALGVKEKVLEKLNQKDEVFKSENSSEVCHA